MTDRHAPPTYETYVTSMAAVDRAITELERVRAGLRRLDDQAPGVSYDVARAARIVAAVMDKVAKDNRDLGAHQVAAAASVDLP